MSLLSYHNRYPFRYRYAKYICSVKDSFVFMVNRINYCLFVLGPDEKCIVRSTCERDYVGERERERKVVLEKENLGCRERRKKGRECGRVAN